uniref:Mitochondrial fission regulator n=1 Tax=Neolamprologus brichardi TaxID=32507 RepID=A0A3Q4IFK9_NEOBR
MSKEYARMEMDLAFGSVKPYGSSRSIVRRIGTSLPIKPCPRVNFQVRPTGVLIGSRRQNCLVATLADVAWIDRDEDDEDDYFSRPRSRLKHQNSLPSMHHGALDSQASAAANNEAIQKISALETELEKLRAQIAQIVLAQEKSAQPGAPPPPLPCGNLPPLPPPPPPPPLPPPPASLQRTFSAIELIKERRGKKTCGQTVLESRPAEIPSMLDVLKDMNKVKLRSVKSRLVEDDAKTKSKEPADAAALIAEALKRKFAHRHRNDSERDDTEEFKIPVIEAEPQKETILFGQHMLKATGKRKLV